jgi:hypothetical protein
MKLGRPREVADPVRVSVRVEAYDYDALDRIARANGTTIPAVIRHAISVLQTRPQGQTASH